LVVILVGKNYLNSLVNFSNVFLRVTGTTMKEERTDLYIESWLNFVESPIFGKQVLNEWAHNIILGSLESTGIVGGVLICLILGYSLKRSFRLLRLASLRWIGQFLIVYILFSLTAGAIWNAVILWPLIVLVLSVKLDFEEGAALRATI